MRTHPILGDLAFGLFLAMAAIAGCGDTVGSDAANAQTPSLSDGGSGPAVTDGSMADGDSVSPEQDASDGSLPASARFIQMNDVSILLPLAKSVTERDSSMLKAASLGVDGPLIDRELYERVAGEEGGPQTQIGCIGCTSQRYDNLRVVAARIDPCFASTSSFHGDATCRNQLRLVFQALVPNEADAGAADSFTVVDGGVHAFYSITRSEVLDIANAIVNLRLASGRTDDLGPLAQHPIAVSEGLDGAFVRALYDIIQAHAGSSRLVRIARIQSVQNFWGLSADEIVDGVSTKMHIKMLPEGSNLLSQFGGGSLGTLFIGVIGPPATLSPDNFGLLLNEGDRKRATQQERQAAFDAALRIENPLFHTPDTIDCASCHVAGVARLVVGPQFGLDEAGNPNTFTIASPYVLPADKQRTTAADPMTKPKPDLTVGGSTQTNIHMFSYIDTHPSITPRVINETAVIVDYLNSIPH